MGSIVLGLNPADAPGTGYMRTGDLVTVGPYSHSLPKAFCGYQDTHMRQLFLGRERNLTTSSFSVPQFFLPQSLSPV